jgi:nitroreductase
VSSAVSRPLLRTVVDLAAEAPSLHNSQPWRWRIVDGGLELCADPTRWLHAADPQARSLVLSCGAALHHARTAARSAGWDPAVTRWPDGPDSWLLARLTLDPRRRVRADPTLRHPIATRRTDRRRFTSWPVPDERLEHLADAARAEGAHVVVPDEHQWASVALAVARSLELQSADEAVSAEQAHWVDRSQVDGVPSTLLPERIQPRVQRFGPGDLPDQVRDLDVQDRWLVLVDPHDDRPAWLRAGEGLSALWLDAERSGLSVLPLSHPVEQAETRDRLREALGGLAHPLLVLRIGWPSISRSPLPHRPRRPLSDVLEE